MTTVDTSEIAFEQFKQLEHDYIGYQSLTDVPKALEYSEESKIIQVRFECSFNLYSCKVTVVMCCN